MKVYNRRSSTDNANSDSCKALTRPTADLLDSERVKLTENWEKIDRNTVMMLKHQLSFPF